MVNIPTSIALDYLREAASKFGVDPATAQQILLAENLQRKGNNWIVPATLSINTTSPRGAVGLMQVMPSTHANLVKQKYLPPDHTLADWKSQLDAGLAAIQAKQKEIGTKDPELLAIAYNAGPDAVKRFKASGELPTETQGYLHKIKTAQTILAPRAFQADVRKAEPPEPPADPVRRGLDAYRDSVRNNNAIFQQLIEATTTSAEEAAAARRQEAEALIRAGEQQAKVAEITGAIDTSNERLRERIVQLFNLDTRKQDNLISTHLAKQAQLDRVLAPLQQEITERMSVGYFDNPLQWLINATILPGQVAQYNRLVGQYNDSLNEIQRMQQLATAQKAVDIAGIADLLARKGIETADMHATIANAKAATARAEAAGQAAAATMQIGRLQQAMAEGEQGLFRLEITQDQKEAQQREKDLPEVEFNRRLQTVGTALGVPDVSTRTLPRMSKETQELWVQAANSQSFGDSFPEATFLVSKIGNLGNMRKTGRAEFADMQAAFQEAIRKRQNEILVNWKKENPLAARAPTMKEAWLAAASELQTTFTREADTNMAVASTLNPYRVSHRLTVADWRGKPDSKIYKFVADSIKAGIEITDTALLEAIRKEVRANVISPAEAALELSYYYTQAIERNNRVRDLEAMGLPKQTTYKIIPSGRKAAVNLVDHLDLEKLLVQDRVRAVAPGNIWTLEYGDITKQEEAREALIFDTPTKP